MVETLISKTVAWEKESGMEFSYDGVRISTLSLQESGPNYYSLRTFLDFLTSLLHASMQIRLLSMLEEYTILRQEREQERRRLRV